MLVFTGTLNRTSGDGEQMLDQVRVEVTIAESTYSLNGSPALAADASIRAESGVEIGDVTWHFWQDDNGAMVDVADRYGNAFQDAVSNEPGVPAFLVPLEPHQREDYQYYTMFGGHTSTPLTLGERVLVTGEAETLSSGTGSVEAYPVTRSDSYEYLVSFDDFRRGDVVTSERVLWVSPLEGVVRVNEQTTVSSGDGKIRYFIEAQLSLDWPDP